jgi:hypothetical protein
MFTKELAIMTIAVKHGSYGAVKMITNKRLQCPIRLSCAETEARIRSLADTEWIRNLLDTAIYGITANKQMRFKKKFSIRWIEFEAWWETIGIQALWKFIAQCVVHFEYPIIHLGSEISQSIR